MSCWKEVRRKSTLLDCGPWAGDVGERIAWLIKAILIMFQGLLGTIGEKEGEERAGKREGERGILASLEYAQKLKILPSISLKETAISEEIHDLFDTVI